MRVKGTALHPSLKGERDTGIITIQSGSIGYRGDEANIDFPLTGLKIKRGGASDRLIIFYHEAYPNWSVQTSDKNVLKHSLIKNHESLLNSERDRFRSKIWVYGLAFACLAMFGFAASFLPALKNSIATTISKKIPIEWEQSLGDAIVGQFTQVNPTYEDPETQRALENLVKPYLENLKESPYQFHFHIVQSDSVNAFAAPGGGIVIFSGLIRNTKRAEQLLGVLAHEISHVTEQHSLRNMIGSLGLFTLLQFFFGDYTGISAVLLDNATFFLRLKFSRDFEREADEKGFELMRKAKVDPRGLSEFFEILAKRQKFDSGLLQFISTHPASEERIASLKTLSRNYKKESKSNEPLLDLSLDFQKLKDRINTSP